MAFDGYKQFVFGPDKSVQAVEIPTHVKTAYISVGWTMPGGMVRFN